MKPAKRIDLYLMVALLVVYVVWGTTYYAMRVALHAYQPFFMCALRFLLAGMLLFGYTALTGQLRVTRRLLFDALVTGVLLVTLGNGLVVLAEQYVSSGIAALVISAESVMILLLSFLYGRRIGRWQGVGVVLCLVGVVLLAIGSDLRYSPVALAALLIAAAAWAMGSIWSAYHARSDSSLSLVSIQMLIGGAISFVVAWALDERMTLSDALHPNIAMVYLAIFGSIATFVSYNYLMRTVSASLAISYAYVNPAIAFVVGCLFDDDKLTLSTSLSLLAILAGVWLIVKYEQNEKNAEAANNEETVAQT